MGMIAIVKLGLDLSIEIMTVAMILKNVCMIISKGFLAQKWKI